MSDHINNFFTSIGPKLAKKIDKCYNKGWAFLGQKSEVQCPKFETDFRQVQHFCRDINTAKSSGIGDISSKVFKDAFLVLVPQLVYMFNLSFGKSQFPDKWKEATIIPLFKGGKKTEVGNYRPISLLPIPGKLLEKVAHANLSKFLKENNILSAKQGGFRKGFSTASTIASLTDDILSNTNGGLTTMAVFIDLKKAFDTVNHSILGKKLELYGISGSNLDWCRDYLSRRKQVTLANNVLSSSKSIQCGVPQGSVLGPLFFILYINDVQHAIKNSNVQLYADDTVIHTAGNDMTQTVDKLQLDLNRFADWCNANKLSLNVSKTKHMNFGTRYMVKKAKDVKIVVNGEKLQIVPTYKYLGITLDSVLSYNSHVSSVINMVLYKLNLLSKVRKYLTESVALKI